MSSPSKTFGSVIAPLQLEGSVVAVPSTVRASFESGDGGNAAPGVVLGALIGC